MPQQVKKKQNKTGRESARKKLLILTKVKRANESDCPPEAFLKECEYQVKDIQCKIKHFKRADLLEERLKWAFQLTEDNMKDMYNACSWGWNEKQKLVEMSSPNARYLVVSDVEGNPLAFTHFRFDVDYHHPVLYVYELQVSESVQRGGLGSKLLSLLELLAKEAQMAYVRMTIFKHNVGMNTFIAKKGYTLDATSPVEAENQPYTIVSKKTLVVEEKDDS